MKVYITHSRFKLNPLFYDKRQEVEATTEPLVRLEWTNEEQTEGVLICLSENIAYLYALERRLTMYVLWLNRDEVIKDIGGGEW